MGWLHWSEITALQQLAAYSQNEYWILSRFLSMQANRGFKKSEGLRETLFGRWLLGRQIIFNIQRNCQASDFERARKSLKVLQADDTDLDKEMLADIMYWQAIVRSSDDAVGGVEGQLRHGDAHDEAANLATRASLIYEDLQLRGKQIAALISAAEQAFPCGRIWGTKRRRSPPRFVSL